MDEVNIVTTEFAKYEYSVGSWVKWTWDNADVYGEVRDRTKDSFTVDGNKISGDDGESVYKMEEYDTETGEFTGQMVAKPESSLSSWDGPQNASDIERAAQTMTFDMHKERVFEAWNNLVNMTEEQMEMWEEHPCSDVGVDGGSDVRDNTFMLMGQAPDGWTEESYQIANQIVAWARKHIDELPDDAASGGKGTCPAPLAVHMLNRGINPFDEFPTGNPTFEAEDGTALNATEFEVDQDELDEVYSEWSDEVNMTASQLEKWSDHPCANTASIDPSAVRERNMMLLETDKSNWTQKHIDAAKRTISFISRMRAQRPDNPSEGGKGTCPSEWSVSLLNWAYNPFDEIPEGKPNPEQENEEPLDDGELSFAARVATPRQRELTTEFNEYGIRKNYDADDNLVSVDAVFEAMEPGPPEDRNGVRITKDFLEEVGSKDYEKSIPYLMDHERSTPAHVGFVQDVWFDEQSGKLMLQARAYNTGAESTNEVVERLTHEPPLVQDGSVGFGRSYEATLNDDDERELVEGEIQEFSTTPFPGGYDEGGLASNES